MCIRDRYMGRVVSTAEYMGKNISIIKCNTYMDQLADVRTMQLLERVSTKAHIKLTFNVGDDIFDAIDIERVICLNEAVRDSCRKIFKPRDRRAEKTNVLESDSDPELILIIPFTVNIKLKSVTIASKSVDEAPDRLQLYINLENVDFDTVESHPNVQAIDLTADISGDFEYPLRASKFQNVSKLILFLKGREDRLGITYIGLKGEKTNMKRQIVTAVYEAKPQLADHKVDLEQTNSWGLQ
eukprot:TRINITY_DN2631_c0_g1_i1.p1 TRINITY_DN2631_c0_g1~~TRINITY_DN2631_c0_g1_i1.p1  ORF type:complete len:260 (+),score=63.32 TRINITY_DN2631_c0_g1_i1:60-782(+)